MFRIKYKSLCLQQFIKMQNSYLNANHTKYNKENQQLNSEPQLQQQDNEEQIEQNPQFTQIDGKVMKLGGLDYNLLKQQKMQEDKEKRNFMDSLKIKIGNIIGDVSERTSKIQYQKQNNNSSTNYAQKGATDSKYNGLIKTVNQICNINDHKKIERAGNSKKSETYLHFYLGQLDQRVPLKIDKRIGKGSNNQTFVELDEKIISQFERMLSDAKTKKSKKNNLKNKDQKLMQAELNSDSDDDIFGADSENEDQMRDEVKNEKNAGKVNIQIGKKLDFNIEQDIFSNLKRPKPIGDNDMYIKTKDQIDSNKYSFMPQKKKPVINSQQDDGYGECYHQSGPSLQELVDLKKQGIQYYGDLKQFKAKQRKVNINKQYDMVQKIIERKKQRQ